MGRQNTPLSEYSTMSFDRLAIKLLPSMSMFDVQRSYPGLLSRRRPCRDTWRHARRSQLAKELANSCEAGVLLFKAPIAGAIVTARLGQEPK